MTASVPSIPRCADPGIRRGDTRRGFSCPHPESAAQILTSPAGRGNAHAPHWIPACAGKTKNRAISLTSCPHPESAAQILTSPAGRGNAHAPRLLHLSHRERSASNARRVRAWLPLALTPACAGVTHGRGSRYCLANRGDGQNLASRRFRRFFRLELNHQLPGGDAGGRGNMHGFHLGVCIGVDDVFHLHRFNHK